MILPRFEMNIKFNNEKIDINVFPNNFLDFTKGWNDPIHDNIDSIIGSFIFNSIVIFGKRPFIDNNTIDFTPFYSDVIRNERMYKLTNRIKSYCDYISNEKQYSSKVLTAYIKLRTYFFKYCFIKEKIYPISYDSYLEYQLSKINFLRKNDINSFLLYNNTESIFKIIKNNINKMKEIINKEGTIEIGK